VYGVEEIARWTDCPVPLKPRITKEAVRNQFFINIFLVGKENEEDFIIEEAIIYKEDEQILPVFGLHDDVWLQKEDLCSICVTYKKNLLIQPCGHVGACTKCRLHLMHYCILCEITNKIRAIFV